jgi:NAD(P)H-hydrate repair Nnr-like enzyme with NAD(P)H-hydrate dehydratase domain
MIFWKQKLLEVMTLPMPETKAQDLRAFRFGSPARVSPGPVMRVAIGPGLTTHPETVDLVQELVKRIDKPCVLDADALNALAGKSSLLTECKRPPIITPHPGEMARLETEATTQSVNEDRLGTATRFARERGVFVILKGARTVIARPDGLAAICPTGNPGMATAGTGDILTGMVGGLLAQGLAPWDAALRCNLLSWFGRRFGRAASRPSRHDCERSHSAHPPMPSRRPHRSKPGPSPAAPVGPPHAGPPPVGKPWRMVLRSPRQTHRLGRCLGTLLQGGEVLALFGELGAGKTSLVKGIADGLLAEPTEVRQPHIYTDPRIPRTPSTGPHRPLPSDRLPTRRHRT